MTQDSPVFETIKLCLDHGADVNAANGNGETLLHQAVPRGDVLVRLLAERGARLDVARQAGTHATRCRAGSCVAGRCRTGPGWPGGWSGRRARSGE